MLHCAYTIQQLYLYTGIRYTRARAYTAHRGHTHTHTQDTYSTHTERGETDIGSYD